MDGNRKPRKPRKLDHAEFWLMTNDPEYMTRSEDWSKYQRESPSGTPSPKDYYAPPDVVEAIETRREDKVLGLMAWLAFKSNPEMVTRQMIAGFPLWKATLEKERLLKKEIGPDEIRREIKTRKMALLRKIHPRRCACGCGKLLTDWTHRSDATYFSRSHQMRALMRERRKPLEITMLAVSTSPSTEMEGKERPERNRMYETIPTDRRLADDAQALEEISQRLAVVARRIALRFPAESEVVLAVDNLLADIERRGS